MEVPMFRGFNDLGMDDLSFYHQLQVNSFEELYIPPLLPAYSNNFQHGINNYQTLTSKTSLQTDNHTSLERPTKQIKTSNWNVYKTEPGVLSSSQDSSTNMLSFANSNCSNQATSLVTPKEETAVSPVTFQQSETLPSLASIENRSCVIESPQVVKKSSNVSDGKLSYQSKDHIMAERRRREKLSQRFIALSAVLPGLKKMDKASVLADASKYIKQLQERVKTLEEQSKSKNVESAVLVKRSRVFADDEPISAAQETASGAGLSGDNLPEIEARFSDKDVLIRIHCEKRSGILEKLITQIEKLQLVVMNSSALAFGSSTLDVTIIAQMGATFGMTAEDLVRHLHAALKPLI